ncbi:MAG: hypothetical protein Q9173_003869, partial [Seirophora scorigena]
MENDVAVIGMACRVAGAASPSELWENLLASKDVQKRITRFNINGVYHSDGGPLRGLTDVDRAYMLEDDATDKFDNAFFHVTPTEAIAMDPQQRMLLEVSYEAVENAGIPLESFVGTDTAVFLGRIRNEGSDYHSVLARDPDVTPKYIVTGTAGCMTANRLSYFYDLSGPSMRVDTACSSSMAALHQAVRTLQHGDSAMALVCGANLIFNPDSFISMTELGFLSPSGRCRSFDAVAQGYGRGEGIAAILLKPLPKAIADRDPIRAVVKGTRLNQDGRTQGITLPSALAQQRNMEKLYHELDILPSTIQYLEAHGTGTAAGDPLELQAVNAVYAGNPLVVGSVKSNVGHCEAASALIGLIKTVLCLEHAQVPAQMHFEAPSPAIDFSSRTIPTNTLKWPESNGHPKRAAINTFGAGGTNGHAVVEAYKLSSSKRSMVQRPWLFKVSAADELSLQALFKEYANFVKNHNPDLRDVAHTLLAHRSSLRYMRLLVASTHDDLLAQLQVNHSTHMVQSHVTNGKLLFVLTGQGAQWAQMGLAFLDQSPLFRSVLQECDDALKGLPNGPVWSIIEELAKFKGASKVTEAEYAQPLCTALQIAIVCLLRCWGIRPDAVVGHSSGEIAAAFAAGMVSLRVAIITAYHRGLLFANNSAFPTKMSSRGSMCAVGMSADDCMGLINNSKGQVQLAAINSPRSCTLSGEGAAIDGIVETCTKRGQFCRLLKVDQAYHSRYMLPLGPLYERLLQEAGVAPTLDTPICPMFSSVTGAALEAHDLTPAYWARNLTSTVRFASATEEAFRTGSSLTGILEIGPHGALQGPIQQILGNIDRRDVNYFSTCKRGTDDLQVLLESIGKMIAAGVPVSLTAINATDVMRDGVWTHEYGNVLTDLPSYQWNHSSSFWFESRAEGIPGASPAIYTLMAVEAARQLWSCCVCESSAVQVMNVKILESLPLSKDKQTSNEVETQFISNWNAEDTRISFEIHSVSDEAADTWTLCCAGDLKLTVCRILENCRYGSEVPGDPISLQKARACYPSILAKTDDVRLNDGTVQGSDARLSNSWQDYPIDPGFLGSIMSLGPVSILSEILPVYFRVTSIEMVHMRIKASKSTPPRFEIRTKRIKAGGADSVISVHCDGEAILAGRLRYEANGIVSPKPTTSSLFFKSVCLPDITKHMDVQVMNLETCLLLLTHKWPMCDIRVGDIPAEAQRRVLEILTSQLPGAKRRFRSVMLHRDSGSVTHDDRVRKIKEHDTNPPAHLTLAGPDDVAHLVHGHVQPFGLACIQQSKTRLEELHPHAFEYICEITGLDENLWTLCRVRNQEFASMTQRKRVIFSPRSFPLLKGRNIPVEPERIRGFLEQPGFERYNAIIVDGEAKPIITSWTGGDLIPWLQHLLRHAESLLWVSRNSSASASVNVAGTLLRTLQAEQPSLKVSWLVVGDESVAEMSLVDHIEATFSSMLLGSNELKLAVDGKQTLITRYLPDEDLSLATGLSLPRWVHDPLGDGGYTLAMAAPKEPVVLSYDADISPTTTSTDDNKSDSDHTMSFQCDTVTVAVTASLISDGDLAAYEGKILDTSSRDDKKLGSTPALGTFFTGKVQVSRSPRLVPETSVVGWTRGAHASLVDVPETKLYHTDGKDDARMLAEFTSLATAMTIVDGHIRARREDHFQYVNVNGMLHEALMKVCRHMQVAVPEHRTSRSPTFVIEVSTDDDVLVNGIPINVTSYLETRPTVFDHVWKSHTEFIPSWQSFRSQDYKAAFEPKGSVHAHPTVLIHGKDTLGLSHVPIHRPRHRLAASNGACIIIGGLGGLGRHVCRWLVDQGASTLHIISRSGISTPEAQQLCSTLNNIPSVQLQVHLADACDRPAISTILSNIRATTPITAIINMAMLLGDAPLARMTAEEWDRALRVKIDSSTLLHELTANDKLEAFILFSSIASVLGNRSQAGYNVGNAFLNALAAHRRREGKAAVSIALGAMTDIGVLTALPSASPAATAQKLTRSGLSLLSAPHLDRILEAAFVKSRQQRGGEETRPEDSLMVTGLEMFEKEADGRLFFSTSTLPAKKAEQQRLFWTELPEFSHLSSYRAPSCHSDSGEHDLPLRDRLAHLTDDPKQLHEVVRAALLRFVATTLG